MSCLITKDICGEYGRWEGIIDNAQNLTEQAAQKVAQDLIRRGENVNIKVYNPKLKK